MKYNFNFRNICGIKKLFLLSFIKIFVYKLSIFFVNVEIFCKKLYLFIVNLRKFMKLLNKKYENIFIEGGNDSIFKCIGFLF